VALYANKNQKMKNLSGNLATYSAAAILLLFGFIYLFRNSFMPYHSAAVSLAWTQVSPPTQYLLLALMRATAGGFISLAFAIIFLQYKFSTNRISWIPLLILLIGTISMICITYATLLIRFHTPGRPPLADAVIGEVLLIAGFIFIRKYFLKAE
jgi:glycosyltransferase involved in cell wall biosynthesis